MVTRNRETQETLIDLEVITVYNQESTYSIIGQDWDDAVRQLIHYAANCYLGWQTYCDERDQLRNYHNWTVARNEIIEITKCPF